MFYVKQRNEKRQRNLILDTALVYHYDGVYNLEGSQRVAELCKQGNYSNKQKIVFCFFSTLVYYSKKI